MSRKPIASATVSPRLQTPNTLRESCVASRSAADAAGADAAGLRPMPINHRRACCTFCSTISTVTPPARSASPGRGRLHDDRRQPGRGPSSRSSLRLRHRRAPIARICCSPPTCCGARRRAGAGAGTATSRSRPPRNFRRAATMKPPISVPSSTVMLREQPPALGDVRHPQLDDAVGGGRHAGERPPCGSCRPSAGSYRRPRA